MLEILSKKHELWVKMARGICHDNYIADDIVSEMYLKLKDYDKELNDVYIYFALKSCFIDWIRNEKKTESTELLDIRFQEEEEENFLKIPDFLTWTEKQILILRYDHSLRDIEKIYKINYRTVARIQAKAKAKIDAWKKKD